MQIVKLHDEVALLSTLRENTIDLIHATKAIIPIKKLVEAHDIISLTIEIEKNFTSPKSEIDRFWDLATIRHLNRIRTELNVFYRLEFSPVLLFDKFNHKLLNFLNLAQLNLNNKIVM